MSINKFVKEAWVELKKVVWPKRRQVMRSTIVVILFTLAVTAFLGGLDFVFAYLLKLVLPS